MFRPDKAFMMRNPSTTAARIYVGCIADGVVADDLEERFKAHGKILGVVLQKGFGFVQFEHEDQAQAAIRTEHNQMFRGKKLNVKQAIEKGRTNAQNNVPQVQPQINFEKPIRSLVGHSGMAPKHPQVEKEDNMMVVENTCEDTGQEKDELENDPFANSDDEDNSRNKRNRRGPVGRQNQRGRWRGDFKPRDTPAHQFRGRGDVGDGPPRPDIHRDSEPVVRGDAPQFCGREEHFRDRSAPVPVFIPPPAIDRPERNDCEIIVVSKALTEYAEFIEQKLKAIGLVVDLLFPNEDVPIGRVLANISSRGCLYAILIMPVNEEFRSLTLNILHGIPQEHRNMPIEDSLILISRNFDSYMRGEKTNVVAGNSAAGVLSERHPEQLQIICNLLAENRQLTTAQYDRLLKYLQERRDLQSQYEIRESGAELNADGEPNTKQAELQNRIMNILNKSSDDNPKAVETPSTTATQPTPLLNDPSVQKALDSLLSGDMFKSMSASGF